MSRSEVKAQGHQGQKTRSALRTPPWTEWNAIVADNVAQGAGATIRSLRGGDRDFADLRALGLADYRWALPHISSSQVNAEALDR